MPKRKANGKMMAPSNAIMKKQETKKIVNPLLEKRTKNFVIRTSGHPDKRKLTRFVKWPGYIRLQLPRVVSMSS
ncbi:60S ribosomal protein L7a [Galemys pyrenaicus]|uniref:60S ribosomal protein L7a n=1 Tax=Galemys pyrenaicus TaxID=202257 RepID=A0A8J6AAK2_GALPY|nr:60S ribosomal protein L7a [Galemys pyrenaicus]